MLRSTMRKIDKVLERPAYNFIVHSAPVQDPALEHYHWHLEIIPEAHEGGGVRVGNGLLYQSRLRRRNRHDSCGRRAWARLQPACAVWYKTLVIRQPVTGPLDMPDKKKSPAAKKTDRRMSKPQGPKSAKTSEPGRPAVARDGVAAVAQPSTAARQLSSFEAAMRLFTRANFRRRASSSRLPRRGLSGTSLNAPACTFRCATGGYSRPRWR